MRGWEVKREMSNAKRAAVALSTKISRTLWMIHGTNIIKRIHYISELAGWKKISSLNPCFEQRKRYQSKISAPLSW